jgi:glycosyltransferase involved in cell wall biosynthesis
MDKKIKIFHIIESGDLSGSGRMVANICNRLNPAKFDITLVYATRTTSTPQEFESIFNGNIHKIYFPDMVRSPNLKKDISALFKLYKLFKKEKPDVVHGHSSKGGFLARFASLLTGVPRVFYSPYGYSFRMIDASIVMRIIYFIMEALVSPIGYIVVSAPSELNIAKKLAWNGKVLPYYNGIDISEYTPKYPEYTQSPTVAACGRITPARNPAAFVRLCSKIEKQCPKASFVWIGSDSKKQSEELQKLIKQLEIKCLRITGWLDHAEMCQEMKQADVFIHYSKWDALPAAVFEAMAMGKPVIGSKAVDQIIHGENGYIANSDEELFEFTCQLLDSWELRNKIGKKAREIVEKKYNLDKLITQLEKAYLTFS